MDKSRHQLPVNGAVPLIGQGPQQVAIKSVHQSIQDGPLMQPHTIGQQVVKDADGNGALVIHSKGGQTKMEAATVAIAASLILNRYDAPGLHKPEQAEVLDHLATEAATIARRCLTKARELDPHFAAATGGESGGEQQSGSENQRADDPPDPETQA